MPPRTNLNEKQITVRRFMDIIAAAGIQLHHQQGNRYIKWNVLPEHLWELGLYLRIPREIIFDSPSQTVEERIHSDLRSPWTEENAEIMKKALDAGEVRILPRSEDRLIVFEAFDQNRTITEVGKFERRKRDPRRIPEFYSDMESSRGETDNYSDSESVNDGEESVRTGNTQRSKGKEVFKYLKQIYETAHLDTMGQPISWRDLPHLLARKKLYMTGIPVECVPNVIDDQMDRSSLPLNWSDGQYESFINAAKLGAIKLLRRTSNVPILFQWTTLDGSTVNSTLQFSPAWIQKHMRTSVVNNDGIFRQKRVPAESDAASRVPTGAVITASGKGWVVVEESTDEEEEVEPNDPKDQRKQLRVQVSSEVLKKISDADIRGDGAEVTWNTLPAALANSNQYLVGIPSGGLPKVKDDKVIFQASHPSLWSGEVIAQMKEILQRGELKILPRPPGRIVLFEVVDANGKSYDTTLGFSQDWLVMNMNDPIYDKMRAEVSARLKAKTDRSNQQKSASPKPKAMPKPQASKTNLVKEEVGIENKAVGARSRKAEAKARAKEESARARAHAEAFARERAEKLERSSIVPSKPAPHTFSFHSRAPSRSTTPSVVSSDSIVPVTSLPNHTSIQGPVVNRRYAIKAKRSIIQNGDASAPSTDASRHSRGWSFSTAPGTVNLDSQSSLWSPVTGTSEQLVRSPETIHAPPQSWPPPGYPKVTWDSSQYQSFSDALARFFARHALTSKSTPIPWLILPQLLAERKQYLRGVPFICLPMVKEDRVDPNSSVKYWSDDTVGAMEWVLKNKILTIRNREQGRRVLFEVIGSDGSLFDSTLGYSESWLDALLPDTTDFKPLKSSASATSVISLSPVLTLKRHWSDSTDEALAFTGSNGMSFDRDAKRRRIDDDKMSASGSSSVEPDANTKLASRLGGFKITFARSATSPGSDTPSEETIDSRDLELDRLIPSHLPRPLQKGRVFLKLNAMKSPWKVEDDVDDINEIPGLDVEFTEEVWEWIPPVDHPKSNTSIVWNPTQARWRVVASPRSLEHLGAVMAKDRKESPDVVQGNILGRGNCEYNESRAQWEIQFKLKDAIAAPWVVRWDGEFGKWEWALLERD